MAKNQAFSSIPPLNKKQEAAAFAPEESPLLVVAGAGTGKTRTLTARILFVLSRGAEPHKICAITFTNKAAREMRERVFGRKSAGDPRIEPFIGTFHSLGAKILREEASRLRRTPSFTIFDEQDSFSLVKRTMKELGEKSMSPALFRDAISLKKNGGEDALDERKRERILHTFSLYEAALERNNAFDFDDLIEKTTLLLRSDENLRKKYLERFSHVFVDEYQDLNRSQHELIRLLVGEHTSLTAVGDAEQTIYGWRGSDIRIFFSFPSEWKKSHLTALDQNYRSTKNILEAAGSVITENEYESDIPRAINLSTDRGEGERIQIYAAEDEEDEAVWVASRALGNKEESIAVLYRTNAQSRPIEAALIAYNIPYHIYGGIKFYERREIKDILAGLRLAVNPHDEISRERLEKALTKRRAKVLFEKLPLLAEKAPKEAVESFVRDAEYLPYIEEHLTNPSDRLENVEELIRFASEFTSLSVFLERITLLQSTDTKEERGSAHIRHPVQLMTMHMAKGLEFDCVFVLGVNEGFIPHVRSTKSLGAIQEERRLLYVAMTRARKNLSLSFYGIPSRFLSPLRSENITWIGIKNSYEAYADEENYITLD